MLVSVKKLNESEPSEDVSKVGLVNETIGCFRLIGGTVTEKLAYWLQVYRHIGGRSFTQAFIGNVRSYHYDELQMKCNRVTRREPERSGVAD